jgi:eukaryotic-like serine/threonine-protein kinase
VAGATTTVGTVKSNKTVTAKVTAKLANTTTVSINRDTAQRPASAPVGVSAPTISGSPQQHPTASNTPGISAPYKLDHAPHSASTQTASRPNAAPNTASATAHNATTHAHSPSGPREACEGKILFSYGACLIEQCERSTFHNHPVCVERREQEARRKASDTNR